MVADLGPRLPMITRLSMVVARTAPVRGTDAQGYIGDSDKGSQQRADASAEKDSHRDF
jgi:hypothetical protein